MCVCALCARCYLKLTIRLTKTLYHPSEPFLGAFFTRIYQLNSLFALKFSIFVNLSVIFLKFIFSYWCGAALLLLLRKAWAAPFTPAGGSYCCALCSCESFLFRNIILYAGCALLVCFANVMPAAGFNASHIICNRCASALLKRFLRTNIAPLCFARSLRSILLCI